ncbi:MAG: Sua5/YciO/YrdC/YwlC family protein, partial [Polyangiaceae bacterium]|nr:Sua5/YciO/YrdC/YwlC family protein [Polyangiaceae bacterium]
RALIEALGEPIAAPSANRYQGISPTTAAHVVRQLGAAVDFVLDGGSCAAGIESTVVDVRGERPRILRPGATAAARVRAVVPNLEATAERASREAARASPGMGARHYAPRARLHIAITAEVAALIEACAGAGLLVGAITHSEGLTIPPASGVTERRLGADPEAYASRLYATLHDLDDRGVDVIVVEAVPPGDAWWAIEDRLRRATAVE